jgi:3-phosphoshikimate 1-carboxyvinyltransferase
LIVAASVTPGSELVVEDLLLNPGRIEFVDALRSMGADIAVHERDVRLGEPVGSVTVRARPLRGTAVVCHEAIIDEVPALAVAAAFADGTTEFRDGAELRVKESDRVASVLDLLAALDVRAEPRADGLVVHGGAPRPGRFRSHGDHRIALAAAAAANATSGTSTIEAWSAVDVSYPGFLADLDAVVRDR